MAKLKQLFSKGKPIPTLILLLGALLMFGGYYTATSSNSHIYVDFRTLWVSPLMLQGILEILIGVVVTVFGYLLFHGKISYFNTK